MFSFPSRIQYMILQKTVCLLQTYGEYGILIPPGGENICFPDFNTFWHNLPLAKRHTHTHFCRQTIGQLICNCELSSSESPRTGDPLTYCYIQNFLSWCVPVIGGHKSVRKRQIICLLMGFWNQFCISPSTFSLCWWLEKPQILVFYTTIQAKHLYRNLTHLCIKLSVDLFPSICRYKKANLLFHSMDEIWLLQKFWPLDEITKAYKHA